MPKAEHDYVEYQFDVEGGEIVACRYFGEGKQVEPLNGLKVYKPAGQDQLPDSFVNRVERRLRRAFKSAG